MKGPTLPSLYRHGPTSEGLCEAQIFNHFTLGAGCRNVARYEFQGHSFCGAHNPIRVFERRQKRDEKWNLKYKDERRKEQLRLNRLKNDRLAREALKKITEGELNDPVGYALLILGDFLEEDA